MLSLLHFTQVIRIFTYLFLILNPRINFIGCHYYYFLHFTKFIRVFTYLYLNINRWTTWLLVIVITFFNPQLSSEFFTISCIRFLVSTKFIVITITSSLHRVHQSSLLLIKCSFSCQLH